MPSAQEAADLYEVRAALEALACRRFVRHATDAQVKRLRKSFREIERLAKRRDSDIQEMLAAKDDFYDVLLEGSGNTAIRETLDGLRARVRLLRATSLSQPNRSAGTVSEIRRDRPRRRSPGRGRDGGGLRIPRQPGGPQRPQRLGGADDEAADVLDALGG